MQSLGAQCPAELSRTKRTHMLAVACPCCFGMLRTCCASSPQAIDRAAAAPRRTSNVHCGCCMACVRRFLNAPECGVFHATNGKSICRVFTCAYARAHWSRSSSMRISVSDICSLPARTARTVPQGPQRDPSLSRPRSTTECDGVPFVFASPTARDPSHHGARARYAVPIVRSNCRSTHARARSVFSAVSGTNHTVTSHAPCAALHSA
jgi:hypothetical protein